jgi:hypothetical protein
MWIDKCTLWPPALIYTPVHNSSTNFLSPGRTAQLSGVSLSLLVTFGLRACTTGSRLQKEPVPTVDGFIELYSPLEVELSAVFCIAMHIWLHK